MITTLHIKNIGIIDDLSIDLNQGLNVLTGETGAGKTLIIDSIGIISGGRFSKEMIRKGENTSYIEICMYEPNSKEVIDGNIIDGGQSGKGRICAESQRIRRNLCTGNLCGRRCFRH